MIDLGVRRQALEMRLRDLVASYQQAQQQVQALQVEVWKVQGKLEELHDLQAQVDGQKEEVPRA